MYREFFGLAELPFSLTPNTDFYYGLPPHNEALDTLRVALLGGEGFIKVTGEVGTGKTMLLRKLLNCEWMQQGFEVAYLPNPYLTAAEMRAALASELGIELDSSDSLNVTDAINRKLIELNAAGRRVAVIIDEAQDLPSDTLEAIRLFGNLETESAKLAQIVLFGQPELDRRLALPEFRQLRQRITFSYELRPLTRDETAAYVEFRMRKAGLQGMFVFSPKALKVLWKAGRGVPRLINVLAHKSLMLAYGAGSHQVKAGFVKLAARDTEDVRANHHGFVKAALCLIGLFAGAALIAYGLNLF